MNAKELEANLIAEWKSFCLEVNLPHISADELLHELCDGDPEELKTSWRVKYVSDFMKRWEKLEEMWRNTDRWAEK